MKIFWFAMFGASLLLSSLAMGIDVRKDEYSGETIVDSDTFGAGFLGFGANKATLKFTWGDQALDGSLMITAGVIGIHNISDVRFNLGDHEIKFHSDKIASYGNDHYPSTNFFIISAYDFNALSSAMEKREIKMLVSGEDTYSIAKYGPSDYQANLLPFIRKIKEIKGTQPESTPQESKK